MTNPEPAPKGSGWASFATILFLLAGILNVIAGIAALAAKDKFSEASMVYANLTLAGAFWLVLGGLQLLSSWGIHNRSQGGRILGIMVSLLGACVWFFFLDARPLWALVMIAIYTILMYTLTKYAEVFSKDSTPPESDVHLTDIPKSFGL